MGTRAVTGGGDIRYKLVNLEGVYTTLVTNRMMPKMIPARVV